MTKRGFFTIRRRDAVLLVLTILGLVFLQMATPGCDNPPLPPAEPQPAPPSPEPSEPSPEPTPEPPPPEPQPAPEPTGQTVPSDYIRIERISGILNGTSGADPGLIAETQFLVWAGWRDPLYVAVRCNTSAFYLGSTEHELSTFGMDGMDLVRESEDVWIPRWQGEASNRRCGVEPDPPAGPGWCQVTNVRKDGDWQRFLDRFDQHLEMASVFREIASRCRNFLVAQPRGTDYDSIAGWCQSMRRAGVDANACPG